MHDDAASSPKALAVSIAIGVLATALIALVAPDTAHDAAVIAAIADEVTARACIAQYGPGERFSKPVACALGTRDVPATALSYPLAPQ